MLTALKEEKYKAFDAGCMGSRDRRSEWRRTSDRQLLLSLVILFDFIFRVAAVSRQQLRRVEEEEVDHTKGKNRPTNRRPSARIDDEGS